MCYDLLFVLTHSGWLLIRSWSSRRTLLMTMSMGDRYVLSVVSTASKPGSMLLARSATCCILTRATRKRSDSRGDSASDSQH